MLQNIIYNLQKNLTVEVNALNKTVFSVFTCVLSFVYADRVSPGWRRIWFLSAGPGRTIHLEHEYEQRLDHARHMPILLSEISSLDSQV